MPRDQPTLRRTIVFTLLAGIAAFSGLTLALTQTESVLSVQSVKFIEQNLALLIALSGLVLLVVCGIAALVYGMRHEGREILWGFRNLFR